MEVFALLAFLILLLLGGLVVQSRRAGKWKARASRAEQDAKAGAKGRKRFDDAGEEFSRRRFPGS